MLKDDAAAGRRRNTEAEAADAGRRNTEAEAAASPQIPFQGPLFSTTPQSENN